MWTAAADKIQAYNKNLYNRYIKAFDAAVAEAESKKIKVMPKNDAWLKIWAEHKKDIPEIKVMLENP